MYHVLEVEYAFTLQPDDDVASEKVRSSTYLVNTMISGDHDDISGGSFCDHDDRQH